MDDGHTKYYSRTKIEEKWWVYIWCAAPWPFRPERGPHKEQGTISSSEVKANGLMSFYAGLPSHDSKKKKLLKREKKNKDGGILCGWV